MRGLGVLGDYIQFLGPKNVLGVRFDDLPATPPGRIWKNDMITKEYPKAGGASLVRQTRHIQLPS